MLLPINNRFLVLNTGNLRHEVSPVFTIGVNLRGILRCAHFEVSAAGFDPAEVEVVLRPCLS